MLYLQSRRRTQLICWKKEQTGTFPIAKGTQKNLPYLQES